MFHVLGTFHLRDDLGESFSFNFKIRIFSTDFAKKHFSYEIYEHLLTARGNQILNFDES